MDAAVKHGQAEAARQLDAHVGCRKRGRIAFGQHPGPSSSGQSESLMVLLPLTSLQRVLDGNRMEDPVGAMSCAPAGEADGVSKVAGLTQWRARPGAGVRIKYGRGHLIGAQAGRRLRLSSQIEPHETLRNSARQAYPLATPLKVPLSSFAARA